MDRTLPFLVGLGVVGAASLALYLAQRKAKDKRNTQEQHTKRARHLKLYHSFPFRSCRCAWLAEELGILGDSVEVIPISLHGPEAKGLVNYKREVCSIKLVWSYPLPIEERGLVHNIGSGWICGMWPGCHN